MTVPLWEANSKKEKWEAKKTQVSDNPGVVEQPQFQYGYACHAQADAAGPTRFVGAVEAGQRLQALEIAPVLLGPKQSKKEIGILSKSEAICVLGHREVRGAVYVQFAVKGLQGWTGLKSQTGVDMLAYLPGESTAANPTAQASS